MYLITQAEFDGLTDIVFRWSTDLASMGNSAEANLKRALLLGAAKLRGVCTVRENIANEATGTIDELLEDEEASESASDQSGDELTYDEEEDPSSSSEGDVGG
jgi:hypothetical protein